MGRGRSKAGRKASGGTVATTTEKPTNEVDAFIREMAEALNKPYGNEERERGEIPLSTGDLQAAVEAFAMTHPEVDEMDLLMAIETEAGLIERGVSDNKKGSDRNEKALAKVTSSAAKTKGMYAEDFKVGDTITSFGYDENGNNRHKLTWSKKSAEFGNMGRDVVYEDMRVTSVKKQANGVKITAEYVGGNGVKYTATRVFKNREILTKRTK